MSEPLWMPERDASALPTHAKNGRPMNSHERVCEREPVIDGGHEDCIDLGTVCLVCGCCHGCDDDCCAEYTCPNPACGCSDKAAVILTLPAALPVADAGASSEEERRG